MSDKGLKQGDPLSGELFDHLLAETSEYLDANCQGILLCPELHITHLCFADDVVLVAHSEQALAKALATFITSLQDIGLEPSMSTNWEGWS